jgi:hypothetical protein
MVRLDVAMVTESGRGGAAKGSGLEMEEDEVEEEGAVVGFGVVATDGCAMSGLASAIDDDDDDDATSLSPLLLLFLFLASSSSIL